LAQVYDLMLPSLCLSCKQRTEEGNRLLCPACEELLARVGQDCCEVCGGILAEGKCENCAETEFCFDRARAPFVYQGPAKDLVHVLKYEGFQSPAAFFARAMMDLPDTQFYYGAFNMIVPVPLHRVRRRERGYNQSELIARLLSALMGIPCSEPIYRRSNTPSQTHLSRDERIRNLRSAFALRKKTNVKDKRIILVDDVFTTGSTVNEIARLLKANGAKEVMVLTATRAA
jgi:ComF family protein